MTSIWKSKFELLATIFMLNRFSLLIFKALIYFSFSSKMENEIQFVFRFPFSWRNWKTNNLNISKLTSWILSQIWFTRYPKGSSCQVPWDFPLYNGHADTKNPLFRKQLMYFNSYITGCYFQISFILIVNCNIKHLSRNSHH